MNYFIYKHDYFLMKTFFITGGSKGVGKALAEILLENNHEVIVTYNKNYKNLSSLERKYKNKFLALKCDLSVQKERDKIYKILLKKKIMIDHLINNAAYDVKRKKFEKISLNEIKKIYEVNLFSIYDLIKNILKHFKKKKSWNTIINMTSTAAKFGGIYLTHYAPTKAALENLTIGLSKELAPKKVRVINVAPGVLNTKIENIKNTSIINSIPLKRLGNASEVAKLIYWLTSDDAEYINGTTITISGGR